MTKHQSGAVVLVWSAKAAGLGFESRTLQIFLWVLCENCVMAITIMPVTNNFVWGAKRKKSSKMGRAAQIRTVVSASQSELHYNCATGVSPLIFDLSVYLYK